MTTAAVRPGKADGENDRNSWRPISTGALLIRVDTQHGNAEEIDMSIIDRDYMRLRDDDPLFPSPEGLSKATFLDREQLMQAIEALLCSECEWSSKPEPDNAGHLMACATRAKRD